MRTFLLTAVICLLGTAFSFGQRVLLDVEPNGVAAVVGDCFGAGTLDGKGCISVIENPDKTGINVSDSVVSYIEPAEGETWMGVYFDTDTPVTFGGDSSMICGDVWMPVTADFMLKLENPGTGLNVELQPPVANTTTNAWETICQDVAGTMADGMEATRIVVFFNFSAVPAAATTYYFDNITQPGATMTVGLNRLKFGGFVNAYPNPVKDLLRIADDFNTPHTFIISDLIGREVIKVSNSMEGTLDVSNLQNGAYFLRVVNQKTDEVRTTRFLKN